MKYNIQRLDGRFSYNDKFAWTVSFSSRMNRHSGPLMFNQAIQWMIKTWGWSAEVRQWYEIKHYTDMSSFAAKSKQVYPLECNSYWTWSNGFDDLRIYLQSDKELAFFQLSHTNQT